MQALPIFLSVGTSIMSATGEYMSGMAKSKAANYNSQISQMQARVAEDQAAYKQTEIIDRGRQKFSQAAAASMESGFAASGSIRDLLAQTHENTYEDAAVAIYEGQVKATGFRAAAEQERVNANNYKKGAIIGAATKLLGGVASTFQAKKSGAFGGSKSHDFSFGDD